MVGEKLIELYTNRRFVMTAVGFYLGWYFTLSL